jgi:putative DNA primase/helicase
MTLAAAISSGSALPCGHYPASGGVLIWSGEDDFADTLLPRLIAAGADLSRVYLVGVVREGGMAAGWEWSMSSKALNEGEEVHTSE